ncbi:hypothetical protein [Bacillus wiedmannii]|uniref:hypothetical protein n=1 Tax=Bacillus wiedmannii TaxID=1890302 RepID=UPI003CF00E7E
MGFGSDVIEEMVSPCGDTIFGCGGAGLVVNEIYIGDYSNISTFWKKRQLSQTLF